VGGKAFLTALCWCLQARVKEQETQKKLFTIKRFVCIGGGVALVLVAWALLIATSRNRADPGELVQQPATQPTTTAGQQHENQLPAAGKQ
jgi:hypothetical protein